MHYYNWSKPVVEEAVKNTTCYADTLRFLEIPVKGRNEDTLKKKIELYNLDTSHFTFQPKEIKKYKDQEYLCKNSHVKSSDLKRRLFRDKLKENKCEICGCSEWLGKPIECQLHHIDGDSTNNLLENLQILCPNCHSQTDNYCGTANKNKKEKIKYYCIDCGKELSCKGAKRCTVCQAKFVQKEFLKTLGLEQMPTKEELEAIIYEKTWKEIGEMYKVSDTTIRKWCRYYGLPDSKTKMGLTDRTRIPERTCDCCGKVYKPKTRTSRFCSALCQAKFQNLYHGYDKSAGILEQILPIEELIKLHQTLTWDEIAKLYNTSRNIINALRKKYGIYEYRD